MNLTSRQHPKIKLYHYQLSAANRRGKVKQNATFKGIISPFVMLHVALCTAALIPELPASMLKSIIYSECKV